MSSADKVMVVRPPVHGLSRSKALAASVFGIAAWLIAALFIRYGLPAGLLSGSNKVIVFILTPALTWGGLTLVRRGASPPPADELAAVISIATAAAAFCDVAAMTWAPGLYAETPADVLSGAILILWGVAWALALSIAGQIKRRGA